MGSTRSSGYYGPSDADLSKGAIALVIALLLPAIVAFLCVGCSTGEPESTIESNAPILDTSDSWQMHSLGLPTRSDLMEYHMFGRWGFSRYEDQEDGTSIRAVHIYEAVPGRVSAWDDFYALDMDNPAYIYPTEGE